jgi:glycosyltransferase involved in cell wall biosynthesis
MKFSVLMSVYIKEDPDFLNKSIESILINQTRIPDELIIVKDGPLTIELNDVIEKYLSILPNKIHIIDLGVNKGLGEALRIGLEKCSYDIVARMDSDDINDECRFEKQIDFLINNPEVDIVGAYIAEFFNSPNNIEYIRTTPTSHEDVIKMAKRRNPMNHVSVMFRKSSVLYSGSYKHMLYLEDYYLWIRMIAKGYIIRNIDEPLVYVRTGENMFKRRSNPDYIKSWASLQQEMKKHKLIDNKDYLINMINIVAFIYMPSRLKKLIYKIFLRKRPV